MRKMCKVYTNTDTYKAAKQADLNDLVAAVKVFLLYDEIVLTLRCM